MRLPAWIAVGLVIVVGAPAHALTFEEARHLLARTGFGGATVGEIEALLPLDYEEAVESILDGVSTETETRPPRWVNEPPPPRKELKELSAARRRDFNKDTRERGMVLKEWWLGEMLATGSPLTERLVLFWHNHFTSSLKKVKWPPALYRQNALFRRHALGNFAELLHQAARDPAMLYYLDGQTNRVGRPNENFARELMELFTLGEGGGYTEDDIREAARALTGWRVDFKNGGFVFQGKLHDGGVKTFLDREGRFDGEDIVDIILQQPGVAGFIARKMWRAFVSETPDEAEVRRLATLFRNSGYQLRPLLKGLLMSPAFRDPGNRGILIKSPIDLVVGTLRLFAYRPPKMRPLINQTRNLGQDLFDPPNVKGWPGGASWITASTLPARHEFTRRLASTGAKALSDRPANGLWDKVLVMTYAEFGRRVAENGSQGTDHGTAAPHFLLGGRVRGGLYGEQPPLDGLEADNLVHRLHFRGLYATVAREWWGLEAPWIAARPLGCIAT